MKSIYPFILLTLILLTGCSQRENETSETTQSTVDHLDEITKFQAGQRKFKELIATVRDEASFDAAQPELNRVVSDWREVAASLRDLESPPKPQQAEYRSLIDKGHRATEPTSEDMMSLISIESREAEVTQWLKEFTEAGGAAIVEMTRLYGVTASGVAADQVPKTAPKFIQVQGGTQELNFDWVSSEREMEAIKEE